MKISDYVESQIKGLWGTDFDENGIPVIKTNNLTYEGHIDYSDICKRNITREHAKECYLKPGDLLIEKSGGTKTHPVGYVSYFEGDENKFVCNNFILALRLKNTINSKFLFYQIQFKYESNQFSDCFNKTTGIQNLKVKDYLAKEIKIYSPEEQEKIVKELDTVRLIINKNKQILEKYDILIKSRFIEMFGDPVQNPMRWEKTELGNLCKEVRYGTSKPASENGKYTYLRMNNITYEGELDLTNIKSIDISDDELPKCSVKKGDILFNRTNSIELCGKTCLYKLDETMVIAGYIIRVRVNEKLNPQYVSTFFNTKSIKKLLKEMAKGAVNQANINAQEMQSIQIPVPPISLQNEYESFVQQIDKSKFAVQKSLEKAETLYKSLMQEYFG